MESPTENSGGLREELRSDAQTMSESAAQRVHSELDARKGDAASQVKTLSSALGSAAEQIGPDSPSWLKSAFEQGAQKLQQFADTVEQKDSRQLTEDVRHLAVTSPGTFLAGCALAGFAAARVFKVGSSSTSQGSPQSSGLYDPYGTQDLGGERPATAFSSGSDPQLATAPVGGSTL